jgi:hypothetical protein
MKTSMRWFVILLVLFFACESKTNPTYSHKETDSLTSNRVEKAPALAFTLMERRNAATALSWDSLKSKTTIHWLKFYRPDSLSDGYRNILYRFYVRPLPSNWHYRFDMTSTKGKDTLFVSEQKGFCRYEINFVFDKPMYDIDTQFIKLTLLSGRNTPEKEFLVKIVLDQTMEDIMKYQ